MKEKKECLEEKKVKRVYKQPSIDSEPLFESVAGGIGKTFIGESNGQGNLCSVSTSS